MNGSLTWSAMSRPVESPRDSRYLRISASTSLMRQLRLGERSRLDRHEFSPLGRRHRRRLFFLVKFSNRLSNRSSAASSRGVGRLGRTLGVLRLGRGYDGPRDRAHRAQFPCRPTEREDCLMDGISHDVGPMRSRVGMRSRIRAHHPNFRSLFHGGQKPAAASCGLCRSCRKGALKVTTAVLLSKRLS